MAETAWVPVRANAFIPMKTVLFVLLAASLAANIMLGLRANRPASRHSADPSGHAATHNVPPAGATGSPAVDPSGRSASQAGGGTGHSATTLPGGPVPHVWHPVASDDDMRRTVADLRASGYPAAVVRAVVNQLLNERFAPRQPNADQPFWKQSAPTPEMVAAQNALNQERRALFEALLGPDARPSAALDESARQRRYGSLGDEKIDAVARIERDYSEMTAETWAKRRGNLVVSNDTLMQSQQLMEQEKLADMAAVLTPEELIQYEMRNAQAARTLINNLRNVDVTETEYARLYQAQKAFSEANPRRTIMDAATFAERQAAQMALNEEARAVLGETRFYSYVEGSDFQYANVAKAFVAFPSVAPSTAYQVYGLQTELQALMIRNPNDGPPSPERIAEMRTTVEAYNQRLESLVGAEAAEAYRKQGAGRMFTSFRNAPRPAPSTQTPTASR